MIRYVGENVVETVCKFAVMNTLYPVMTVNIKNMIKQNIMSNQLNGSKQAKMTS